MSRVHQFSERVKAYASGCCAPEVMGEGFEEATPEHQLRFGRATMLMGPGMVASAVIQWMQNPELTAGQFLPEHIQIAAYLGQHIVRPGTRNEYLHSELEGMDQPRRKGCRSLGNSTRMLACQQGSP